MTQPRTARRAVRTAPPEQSAAAREPVRAKVRTRKGVGTDQMHIPPQIIPDGIDLQWNTETVVGQPAQHESIAMAQQGWEPVTTGMFEGRFDYLMPRGHKGMITYGASRLDWRPLELTLEARAEEVQAARGARYREEQKLKAGAVDGVTDVFDPSYASAPSKTFLRKSREPSMRIPD